MSVNIFSKFLLAALLASGCAAEAGTLSANRTALIPGETLELTYTADKATTQDVYLAVALADGTTFFMDATGNFPVYKAGSATPARLSKPAAGTYKLLSFTVPDNFNQDLSFYLAEGKPGSDILSPTAWNYDIDTRRNKSVTFMKRPVELDGTSVSSSAGATLYKNNCFICHNDPTLNLGYIQRGIDPKKTQAKIGSFNPMKYLSKLTRNEVINIAAYIATAR